MKAFVASVVFFVAAVAISGFVYTSFSATASEVFSLDSVRVGHDNPVDGRLGWTREVPEVD